MTGKPPKASLPAPEAAAPPRKKIGGRKPGQTNKKTRERQMLERFEAEAGHDKAPKKLAREVIEEFMHYFAGLAAAYQPGTPTQPNPKGSEDKFERYALIAVDMADRLAPYQSPRLKAIMVSAPPVPGSEHPAPTGKVIEINDQHAAARVYQQLMKAAS